MKKKALPFALSLLLFAFLAVGSYGQNRDFKSSSGVRDLGTSEVTTSTEFYTAGNTMDINLTVEYGGDDIEWISGVEFEFPSTITVNPDDCSATIVTPGGWVNYSLDISLPLANDYTVNYVNNGSGPIKTSNPFVVNITIPAAFSGNLEIDWTLTGVDGDNKTGTLTLTQPSSVDNPTNFTAVSAGTSAIDLSWSKNLADDNVMIAYNSTNTFGEPTGSYLVDDEITGGGTVIYNGSGTSFSHTSLNTGAMYYYKAFSISSGKENSYSDGVEASAMTALDESMTEGFEDGGVMPLGWTVETGVNANSWQIAQSAKRSGTYGIEVTQTDANPKNTWLFSQPVYLLAGTTYILDFYCRSGADTETMDILYGLDASTSMTTVIDEDYTISSTSWTLFHKGFTPATNGVYYIGFHAKSAGDGNYIDIDDINLSTGDAGKWLGAENNSWNEPLNWDNLTVPDASTDVTIADVTETSDNLPVISGGNAATCKNLTIEPNATLTVQSNGTLSVSGNLTLESEYSINSYPAALVDQTTNGVTITGSKTVQLELRGAEVGNNNRWHLISSPVASFNSSDVFWNCFLRTFDESTGAYVNVGEDPTVDTDMEGYATMYYYGTGASTTKMLEFTGSLNTGNKSITCTKTEGQSGWNLVGNPYPSAVDWNLVTDDAYPAGLDNTLYVVDGDNVNSYKPETPPVGNPSSIIPAMQGFFVKCITNNTDLTFKNSYRVSNQATFLKSDFDMHNVLAFVAENETGLKDYMNVYFRENAGPGFDYDWDITKFFHWSELSPQVYVIEDGAYFTNNAYDSQNKPASVEIGFYAGTDGVYKIGLKGTSEIDDDIALHLYDRKENIHVDLREIDQYEFNYSVNDDPARFKLMLNTTGIADKDYFPFNVWLNGNQLMVNAGEMKVEQIRLYDVSGKLLKDVSNAQNQTAIQLPAAKSVYIIQMVTLEGVYSKKIVY